MMCDRCDERQAVVRTKDGYSLCRECEWDSAKNMKENGQ